jgi:hypothetical protein
MRHRLFAIILMLGIPLVGVVAATPVSAQTTLTVEVTSATLVAKGAAVDVELTVACEVGSSSSVFLRLSQRSGHRITQGSQNTAFSCTGQSQIVTVRVVPDAGLAPFKTGDAVLAGTAQACTEFGCQFAGIDEIVHIGK